MANSDLYEHSEYVVIPGVRGATADANPNPFLREGARDIRLDINISAITGTSVVATLEGYDPQSGSWFTIVASAAKTGTGLFQLYAGVDIPASTNVAVQVPLPNRMRLKFTHNSITSVNYSATLTRTF